MTDENWADDPPCIQCDHPASEHSEILGCEWVVPGEPNLSEKFDCPCAAWMPLDPPDDREPTSREEMDV